MTISSLSSHLEVVRPGVAVVYVYELFSEPVIPYYVDCELYAEVGVVHKHEELL
jgi:hypothetical protein